MNIAIVGTGYVGLVTGACFAEMGINVTCVDTDKEKIASLRKGVIPIYEPELESMVIRNAEGGRLHFTTSLTDCLADAEIVFSAVGTPPNEDGSADLRSVLEVARTFGRCIDNYTLLVTKSTVPVGTAYKVKAAVQEELEKRGVDIPFDIASNPEFLKEGDAVNDFMKPDRIVIGVDGDRAAELMEQLYKPFTVNSQRIIFMDILSAELTKYAANAMLATRISFMNDIANLCEIVGADINMVRKGIGTDSRIGNKFLYAGCGFGGSCFPKDVKALLNTACQNGYRMRILEAVEDVNQDQKEILFKKILSHFKGDVRGKTISVWGLSFKPQTDDMREAPSLVLIERLLEAGARINAYDPVAMDECKKITGDKIRYAKDIYDAAAGSDGIVLVTEWKEFRLPDWPVIKKAMKGNVIFDGRNIYDKERLKIEGFSYYGIGVK